MLREAIQLVLPLFTTPAQQPAPNSNTPNTPKRHTATVNGDGVRRETTVGGAVVSYTFRRRRRKSIGFTIDRRGLIVSAPRWVTLAEVDEAVQEKANWIERKQIEWDAFEERRASLDTAWEDGGVLRYLGEDITLRIVENATDQPVLDNTTSPTTLWVGVTGESDPSNIQVMVEAWCQARAREQLGERLEFFGDRLGQHPRRWHLSSAKTQWGSCNADGVIRLNWRLIHLPQPLLDYVVAHEVAHLQELNHSRKFWALVEKLMPGHNEARKALQAMPEHLAL